MFEVAIEKRVMKIMAYYLAYNYLLSKSFWICRLDSRVWVRCIDSQDDQMYRRCGSIKTAHNESYRNDENFREKSLTIAHEDYLTLGLKIVCGVDGVEEIWTYTDRCNDKIDS